MGRSKGKEKKFIQKNSVKCNSWFNAKLQHFLIQGENSPGF